MKCHLHKCVTVQELNKSVATLQTTAAAAHDCFRDRVLHSTNSTVKLLVDILKDYDCKPDESEYKRPESQTPKVIANHPPYALAKK